jgi:hypothetical protein
MVLDARTDRAGRQSMEFHLLRHQLVLLAMKHGRAPLPVAPHFWRKLQQRGVLHNLYDLGSIARRLSFLGDGRLLVDELKIRRAIKSPPEQTVSREVEITTGGMRKTRMNAEAYGNK